MITKHRSQTMSVFTSLLLCLMLALSAASGGLADQPEGAEMDVQLFLPIIMRTLPESTGILDTSFSEDGWAAVNFGTSNEYANATVIQPDGKIVVAGMLNGLALNFALVRYNLDGSLDTSFSGDGKVITFLGGNVDMANAIALQADGKIVVAGYTEIDLDANFTVARYNPDGSLDTTFSGDGIVETDFAGSKDYATAVAVQPGTGKIVVAGYTREHDQADFAVARYNPDGSLDTTFSEDGKQVTNFWDSYYDESDDEGYAVAIQPDGKIIVAGTSIPNVDDFYLYAYFALARYNQDGSLDTTFNGDGKVETTLSKEYYYNFGRAILLLPDLTIVVAGTTHVSRETWSDFALLRYSPNGSLDGYDVTDFGSEEDYAYAAALQADGKIVVAGDTLGATGRDIALARYHPYSGLDTSFGNEGKVVTDFANSYDTGFAVAVHPGGKIATAGFTSGASDDIAVFQYDPEGSLDTSFSEDGKQTTEFAGSNDRGYAMAIQPDGKLVVAGLHFSSIISFALARFNPDGSLDTSFDLDGKVIAGLPLYANEVVLQPDGKILAAGKGYGDFAILRLNPNGSLDTTFSEDGKQTIDINGNWNDQAEALVIQPDGKILLAGTGSGNFALVRLNTDGSLDTTFDGDGKLMTDFGVLGDDIGYAAALQPDGKILVAGSAGGDFAVARYNSDGSLDTTFSEDGMLLDEYGTNNVINALVVQPNGKILMAGAATTASTDFALLRLNPDGSRDNSMAGVGLLVTDFSGNEDIGYDLVLQSNGKILVTGSSTAASKDYALARYNPDGSLDTSFAYDGLLVTDFAGGPDVGQAIGIQNDGRIVVAGYAATLLDYDFTVVRYK